MRIKINIIYLQVSEKAVTTHSSALAWKIPYTGEPGRLQSMGSWRVGHDWVTSLALFTFMQWRRKWQPIPVFLPGESQGRQSLVGCRILGCTESDTTAVTAAAAASPGIWGRWHFDTNGIWHTNLTYKILSTSELYLYMCSSMNVQCTISTWSSELSCLCLHMFLLEVMFSWFFFPPYNNSAHFVSMRTSEPISAR